MLITAVTFISLYVVGTFLNAGYRLMRIAELKIDHDTTRSKDVKNECMSLTRHHMGGLRSVWKWPTVIVKGVKSALEWGKSLESK
jgi:hypothetical protein